MATDVQELFISQSGTTSGATGTITSPDAVLIVGRVAVKVTPGSTLSAGVLLTLEVSANDGTNWVQIAQVRTGVTSGETYGYEFDVSGWEDVRLTYSAPSSSTAIYAFISGIKNA